MRGTRVARVVRCAHVGCEELVETCNVNGMTLCALHRDEHKLERHREWEQRAKDPGYAGIRVLMIEVVEDPSQEFERGVRFPLENFERTLRYGYWPDGMMIRRGGELMRVVPAERVKWQKVASQTLVKV